MMKVLLTDPIPSSLLQWIQTMLPDGVALDNVPTFSDEDFAQHAADADVLLSARRQIDARVLALAPGSVSFSKGEPGMTTSMSPPWRPLGSRWPTILVSTRSR